MAKKRKKKAAEANARRVIDQHFEDLVQNAVDFLERSVRDLLDSNLKFSVVHFYQALELFVKARLLREHWSLIISEPSKASYSSFEKGDFHTVSLQDAIGRLTRIAGEDLRSAKDAFEPVRVRRNQVVHFHAPDMPKVPHAGPRSVAARNSRMRVAAGRSPLFESIPPQVGKIVAEQCRAWYELNYLLVHRWKNHFEPFRSKCQHLDHLMLQVRPYLQTRFDKLQPKISQLRARGSVGICAACGFEASRTNSVFQGLSQTSCLVCLRTERSYRFSCTDEDCEGEVVVSEDGTAECDLCDISMTLQDVADNVGEPSHPSDGEDWTQGYCSDCESHEIYGGTVVQIADSDHYLCLACLQDHDRFSQCEFCGELITADPEGTYIGGCLMCDGKLGWDGDD
jgi:hypothetical protein